MKKLDNIWFVKVQQVGICGTPDFLICLSGHFVALELKKDEKTEPDALQIFNLKKIGKCGGTALVASPENWKATYELLKNLSHGGGVLQ